MAVIINDFGMPSNCMNCPILYDQMYCSITESKVDWSNYDKSRLEDCPLKEVPDNNSVLEDIKADIKNIGYKELDNDIVVSAIVSVDDVIDIIDKHISGKENHDTD